MMARKKEELKKKMAEDKTQKDKIAQAVARVKNKDCNCHYHCQEYLHDNAPAKKSIRRTNAQYKCINNLAHHLRG
jgi:hypothetical protein